MSGHENDIVARQLVGDGDCLFRVAGIVACGQFQLLAENAAGGIDILNGKFGSGLHLFAETCISAGQRADDGDVHVRVRRGRERPCSWRARRRSREIYALGVPP